jgi:uncharacterized protein with GYD domain
MPKYLFTGSYTDASTKGIAEEGGTGHQMLIRQMLEKLGDKLEVFYFAFVKTDVDCITDIPNAVTATAISLVINRAGAFRVTITPHITPEDIDQASKKSVAYRNPGV